MFQSILADVESSTDQLCFEQHMQLLRMLHRHRVKEIEVWIVG